MGESLASRKRGTSAVCSQIRPYLSLVIISFAALTELKHNLKSFTPSRVEFHASNHKLSETHISKRRLLLSIPTKRPKRNKYLLCASSMKVPWAALKSTLSRLGRPTSLSRIGGLYCKRSLLKYLSSRKVTSHSWNNESMKIFLGAIRTRIHDRLSSREMWREEAKLQQQRNNAQEQLRTAERNLASTMDKVRLN